MRQGVLIKPYSISLNLSKSSPALPIGSFGYPRAFHPTKVVAMHGCGGFSFFYFDHANTLSFVCGIALATNRETVSMI
jgi:hypothetical protein